jgi:hypothetical protein
MGTLKVVACLDIGRRCARAKQLFLVLEPRMELIRSGG